MTQMNDYALTRQDIDALNRLIQRGGKNARISRDALGFEVSILSEFGPVAYGSGDTIADAVNKAIGKDDPE
jgi:hypothetical protein